jgi:hypothetical protein
MDWLGTYGEHLRHHHARNARHGVHHPRLAQYVVPPDRSPPGRSGLHNDGIDHGQPADVCSQGDAGPASGERAQVGQCDPISVPLAQRCGDGILQRLVHGRHQ